MAGEDRSDLPPLSAFGSEWVDFVIPDDPAELAAEAEALRAELRDTGEEGHTRAWLRGRHLAKFPAARVHSNDRRTSFFFGACLGLVAIIIAIVPLVTHAPHPVPRLASRALASSAITPGKPGGLMPDLQVTIRAHPVPLRDLRPAVFVLLPAGCACSSVVRNVVATASADLAAVYLVDGPQGSASHPQAAGLADQYGYAEAIEGPNELLFADFGASVVQAVFVGSDGLIIGQPLPISTTTRIESWLDRLNP